jgi:hypothetical protein
MGATVVEEGRGCATVEPPSADVPCVAPGPYSEGMNPRARRLIVSGVLGGLLLIVVITAIWQSLK